MKQDLPLPSKFALTASDLQPLLPESATADRTMTSTFQYFDIQPRAKQVVDQFLRNPKATALVLQSENCSESILLLANYLKAQRPKDAPLAGFPANQVRYHIELENDGWNISLFFAKFQRNHSAVFAS